MSRSAPPPERRRRRRATQAVSTTVSAAMVLTSLVGLAGTAAAVTDEDPEFHLTQHDLEFILKQIKISEAHAAGGDLLCASRFDTSGTCVPDADLPWGLRTVDGSYNNLYVDQEAFGAGSQLFPRLVDPSFRDADPIPAGAPGGAPGTPTTYDPAAGAATGGFVYDADPRIISNLIVDQTTDNPAAVAAAQSVEGAIVPEQQITGGTEEVTRTEESGDGVYLTPGWISTTATGLASGNGYYFTETAGVSFSKVFEGSTVRLLAMTGPNMGTAEISIDGTVVETINLYSATTLHQQVVFQATDLAPGQHTLTVTATGERHPDTPSVYHQVTIDAVETVAVVGGTASRETIFIPNVSPDEGLSAPFNSWFTLFGQFFDHGLDLVSKGGNGTVVIPLQPDDELYDPNSTMNYIMVTRATQTVDENGQVQHTNRTTPFVDQNQTYTSHPSHQFFLREYVVPTDEAGTPIEGAVPVFTGKLLNGDDADGDGERDGLARWSDVKEQALSLGIALDDTDVHDVPMVLTDPYGAYIPGPNGYPQLVVGMTGDTVDLVEGDPANPVDGTLAMETGHAFLDDIAHAAVPGQRDRTTGQVVPHNAELLGDHFVTGDGRGNENIGLTAVHHVFHSEHNRLVDHVDEVLAGTPQAFQDEWRDTSGPWDYEERLFQAARFATEMQYQHLAFEEFGRFVQPNIDNQPLNETAYHPDLNPAIAAEFAHVVYRFGHSMLTETVDRQGADWSDQIDLFHAFLSPRMFTKDAAGNDITPDEGAGAVIKGMVYQTGNGIDEFVTPVLRNQLLGIPLDLAAINIARARETGMPTLQEARQAFWEGTADGALKPYENWLDFELALRHRESIVNFIAAYGIHPTINGDMTVAERRAAAALLREDTAFMTGDPVATGLNDVDFWTGGLAEDGMVFGGLLGNTFNYVFETQLEALQNADRFYYLTRTQGLNLIGQLENNSFTELVMRNTDADILPTNLFTNPDTVIDLQPFHQEPAPELPAGLLRLGTDDWRFDSEAHAVIYGTDRDERIRGGLGDDSLYGKAGHDRLEGGVGNDTIHAGEGDDVVTDEFGDDTIHAGPGDDAVNGGAGFDLIFGNSGQDFLLHGNEITTTFAGAGTDFVRGGNANDVVTGNEDDDWLEGALGHDLVQGDNALTFQNDPFGGADVLIGGSGNDDHDAEGGDDIMSSNAIDRHAGMLGFDWVTHQHDPFAADADLDVTIFQPPNVTVLRARYMNVEGLSGWDKNDVLRGRSDPGDQFNADSAGHELTQEHLDRVVGLRDLLGGGENPRYATPFMITDRANDIILGGAGSDILHGRSGDDFIDGDSALGVWLEYQGERYTSMQQLQARVFSGEIHPSEISIVREVILQDEAEGVDPADVIDTAVYDDVRANFSVSQDDAGYWTVSHVNEDAPNPQQSGTDVLIGVERLQFTDVTLDLVEGLENVPATGTIVLSTLDPVEDGTISVDLVATQINDLDGLLGEITWTWEAQDEDGEWTSTAGGIGPDFTVTDAEVGMPLRVVATFADGTGNAERVVSPITFPVTGVNDAPEGLVVSPSEPQVGDVLMATGLTDADGLTDQAGNPTVTLSHQWQSSSDGAAWTNVPGATAASLEVTQALAGLQLRVVVTYVDNQGFDNEAVSPATSAVTYPAIEVVGSPTLSFSAVTGDAPSTSVVTVRSSGTADLVVSEMFADAVDAGPFMITSDTCVQLDPGATLAPGAECTFEVSFTPTTAGSWTFPVVLVHNAGDPLVVQFDATVVEPSPTFTDVPFTHPASTEIEWLAAEGISDVTSGAFQPTGTVQRQVVAGFLFRYAADPAYEAPPTAPFSDVPVTHPYHREISWMAEQGITTGNANGTYGVTQVLQRQAQAAFLYRLAGEPAWTPPTVSPFTDVSTGSPFYRHITWAVDAGVMDAQGTSFGPAASVTRQDVAVQLYRFDQAGLLDLGAEVGVLAVASTAPTTAVTTQGQQISFALVAADVPGPLTYTVAEAPAQEAGTVELDSAAATATFTPAEGFTGTTSFTYRVADVTGAVSAPVEARVTVAPAGSEVVSNPVAGKPVTGGPVVAGPSTDRPARSGVRTGGLAQTGAQLTGVLGLVVVLVAGGLALRFGSRRNLRQQ